MRKITYEEYKQLAEQVEGPWREYWARVLDDQSLTKVRDEVELGRIICERFLDWEAQTD